MHPTIEKLTSAGPVSDRRGLGHATPTAGPAVGRLPRRVEPHQPGEVEEVARAYVEAGSQVILTNTFGANRFILARHGLADKVAEINRAGRGDFPPRGRRAGDGVRLDRPQRRHADDGRGERRRTEGRLRRTGPGHGRRRRRRHRDRNHVRSGRSQRWPWPPPTQTGLPVVACMTFDSGREEGPHDDGHHARAGRRATCWPPGPT